MPATQDTFEDLPILIDLRSSLSEAYTASDLRQPAARHRHAVRSRKPARAARGRSRRRVLAAGVAIAGLAVAGVLGFHGSGLTPSPAMAATMNRLAHIAADQDWGGIPGPGQYLYTKSEGVFPGGAGNPGLDHRQIWIPSSGHALLIDPRSNRDATVNRSGGPLSYFPLTVNGWKSLSTDPATLLKQIHHLDTPGVADTPAEQFTNVSDALREIPIPPAVRAVLYRSVALIPGVQLIGPQTDPTGQPGLGVGFYEHGHLRSELIFDQHNARLLAEITYDQAGKLTSASSYLRQKIVDSAPSAGSTPPSTRFPQFKTPTTPQNRTTSS